MEILGHVVSTLLWIYEMTLTFNNINSINYCFGIETVSRILGLISVLLSTYWTCFQSLPTLTYLYHLRTSGHMAAVSNPSSCIVTVFYRIIKRHVMVVCTFMVCWYSTKVVLKIAITVFLLFCDSWIAWFINWIHVVQILTLSPHDDQIWNPYSSFPFLYLGMMIALSTLPPLVSQAQSVDILC